MARTGRADHPSARLPGGGDQTLDGQLRSWARIQGRPDISPRVASAAILIWTRVHGIVSLELTGMLDNHPLDAQRLIRIEIDSALQQLAPAGVA